MATHSYALIPTLRNPAAPHEYILAEGWSDGMLRDVGWSWYCSAPRMHHAALGTVLLAGSPVFADPNGRSMEVKEIDYVVEGFTDNLDDPDSEEGLAFQEDAHLLVQAIEAGDWSTAMATSFAVMPLEEKLAQGFGLNARLFTIADFQDIPEDTFHGGDVTSFNMDTFTAMAKTVKLDISTSYFYHGGQQRWWASVFLPDQNTSMYVPMVLALAWEAHRYSGTSERQVPLNVFDGLVSLRTLHATFPDVYAEDIVLLAQYEKDMQYETTVYGTSNNMA